MRNDPDLNYSTPGPPQAGSYSQRDYRSMGRMDPNTRRMAIIAGGIGGSLVLLLGVWSLTGHRTAGVPVVEANSRPVRERPLNKGGLTISGADETIMSGEADGKTVVAPAPEAPAIAALKGTLAEASVPPVETATAETPAQALPTMPAARSEQATTPAVQTTPKVAVAKPPVAHVVAAVRPVAPVMGGTTQVQLAAVSSEEAAKGEWTRLSHRYPDLLAAHRPAVTRIEHDGKTFWRLRVNGFVDTASATTFCGQMRSKGGNCSIADF